jgi:hypothetical protein
MAGSFRGTGTLRGFPEMPNSLSQSAPLRGKMFTGNRLPQMGAAASKGTAELVSKLQAVLWIFS